jgi:phosphoribosylformylglycinamidine (FGAM) synthase-like amidotransferase family enzyme
MTFTDGARLFWPVCNGNQAISYNSIVPMSNLLSLTASHLEARIVWDEVSEGILAWLYKFVSSLTTLVAGSYQAE